MDYSMLKGKRILVVDDSVEIRQILRILLEGEGYEVIEAEDGSSAIKQAENNPDLIVLDINMPNKDGFSVCVEIRKTSFVPILFLTARNVESDKILGLSAGADDYISKPFSNAELLIRIKTLLRRNYIYHERQVETKNKINIGSLEINTDTQNVILNGQEIYLTKTEYDILLLFAKHPKKIFTLDNIYESVWESDGMGLSDNTVMVHIKNLRRKLGDSSRDPQFIKTAWGKGYYIE